MEFEGDEAYDLGARSPSEQGVLETPDLHRVAGELERGGWAARLLPGLRHVEVDPDRLGGRPVIRGRRITVQDVATLVAEPGGRALLHDDYDLDDAQIDDAVSWWATARAFER